MADQDCYHDCVGRVRGKFIWHHRQTPGETHVCGDLVLHRHGCDGRGAAHHELDDDAGGLVQKLFHVCRRARRFGAMVVWPQRRRVLSHDAVSRFDVLLFAEGGESPGVQLSPFDYSLLGVGISLHLGWTAPSALFRAAGLGAIARHGFLADAHRAKLGRHVKWFAHLARRVG